MKKYIMLISTIVLYSCVSQSDFNAVKIKAKLQYNKTAALQNKLVDNSNELKKYQQTSLKNIKRLENLDIQFKASVINFEQYKKQKEAELKKHNLKFKDSRDNFVEAFKDIDNLKKAFSNKKNQLTLWVNSEKKRAQEKLISLEETLTALEVSISSQVDADTQVKEIKGK